MEPQMEPTSMNKGTQSGPSSNDPSMEAKWMPKGTQMKPYEDPWTPLGSQLEARKSQNDATWWPQASKMEQKWIPNLLELELRGRRVGEFPFRPFFFSTWVPCRVHF